MSLSALKDTAMKRPMPKPHILSLSPYTQGKSKAGSAARTIKLSSNENPLGCSPDALAAYRAFTHLERYPDGGAVEIREALAELHNIDAERITVGCGSDELINLLIHAYAGEGDEVLYSEFGFAMYPIYAKAHGATPVTAKEKHFTADVDALLNAVTERTKMLFLANPNNPTGTLLPQSEVNRLQKHLPPHILLVLDAAYAEYVEDESYDAGAKLVDSTDNTVMLRTFSKAYGLPALRLGWAYAPTHVQDALNRLRSPFNVTTPAMKAGVAALADKDFIRHAVAHNAKERARLGQALEALGLDVTPSATNFLLVHFPESGKTAQTANAHLMEQGIIVREMSGYGIPHALRITIGDVDENDAVIASLQQFMRNGQ